MHGHEDLRVEIPSTMSNLTMPVCNLSAVRVEKGGQQTKGQCVCGKL